MGVTGNMAHRKGNYMGYNNRRLAEVWLDEYKEIYYTASPSAKLQEYGDVSDRVVWRKEHHCKPFRWYLQKHFPNMPIPDKERSIGRGYIAQGNAILGNKVVCFDSKGGDSAMAEIGCYPCHNMGANQAFALLKDGRIFGYTSNMCVSYSGGDNGVYSLVLDYCASPTRWHHMKDKTLRPDNMSGYCITHVGGTKYYLQMTKCQSLSTQIWDFSKYS